MIVESFDRLSRDDVMTALGLFMQIIRSGVRVVTLADNRTYTRESVNANPTDLMLSILIMSRAHEESATKSQRVRAAKELRRQQILSGQAKAAGGRCPGWLRIEDGRFVPIAERVAVVKRIVGLGIDGMGAGTIARTLNEQRVPTWSNRGKVRGWTFRR